MVRNYLRGKGLGLLSSNLRNLRILPPTDLVCHTQMRRSKPFERRQ